MIVNNLPDTPYIVQLADTLISGEIFGNQWYINDNKIIGATYQELIIAESGNYFVVLTDSNGCVSEKSNIINALYTFLKPDIENSIRVHPNPMEGYITIEGLPNEMIEISVHNIYGTMLITQMSSPFITNIDLSGLPNGIYLVVFNNQLSKSIKVIKQ